MKVLSVSVTRRGAELAARLPFEHEHGGAAGTVRERWPEVDGFVLFLATGAAVRVVAPLLADKRRDPAVVTVDEGGRFAVALCGGHARGANRLCVEVADMLGAVAVVTTATDSAGLVALDQLPGLAASGDVAGVTTALLDGRPPRLVDELGWPLPADLGACVASDEQGTAGEGRAGSTEVVVTDRTLAPRPGRVGLHPPSLVAGVGLSTGAPPVELAALLDRALASAGLARASLAEVATLDRKAAEPALAALGLPVRSFPAPVLAAVPVPSPSATVAAAVGTPSVAEAAALSAAGLHAELVVPKQVSSSATVAVARRRRPRGELRLVGLGPGHCRHRTPAAEEAVRTADVVVGYDRYVDQCADLLTPAHEVVRRPLGDEPGRAERAVAEAAAGRRVALVCSGDAGVYGMASLTLPLLADRAADVALEVVPGVTAALAAAALLGSPLGADHAVISLSDLHTPWATIEGRVRAAAEADLVVALYNPRSAGRRWQLDAARRILLERRPPETPVGLVTDAARPGQRVEISTLAGLDVERVGMTTCVIVGASATRVAGSCMVTGARR